jgi:glycosyltransferase involved in cell wall biosynthesis
MRSTSPDAGRGTGGPEVSVVTVSFGRVDLVRRKLAALARQTTGPEVLEVVLVDNACPDRVGERLSAASWPFALRVLRSERRLNAAEGRAWAAREARGRWLWWSDDDVVPADDALAAHLAVQARRPGVTIGSVRFVSDRSTTRWRPRRAGPAHFTGVNTVFPRAAWARVADDLPALPRPYGGEDTVLALALQADGVPFTDARGAWVDHHGPHPADGGDPSKGFDAGFNAAVIARHYPHAAWSLGVHPVEMLAKRLLFSPLWCAITRGTPRGRFEHAFYLGAREARRARAAVRA